MRKLFCVFAVLMILASLACPVFASEEFVPSISYKDVPGIKEVPDEDGKPAIGVIRDETGAIISYVYADCLIVTHISEADTSTEIPEASKTTLLYVYDQLKNGDMKLPYEKLGSHVDRDRMVIRDLFDATFVCGEHPEMLEPTGVVLEIIFELGVDAYTEVSVMTYKKDEWNPIVSSKNNGDGTVTCTFEDLCPIVFCVPTDVNTPPTQTGDVVGSNLVLWFALMGLSAVGAIAVLALRRKEDCR